MKNVCNILDKIQYFYSYRKARLFGSTTLSIMTFTITTLSTMDLKSYFKNKLIEDTWTGHRQLRYID
jgi:hypothetical protein